MNAALIERVIEENEEIEEIDESLLEWHLSLTVLERLRGASKHAAVLERLRRAASTDR
ncbi:MAG: hypothetical protein KF773_31905 [Deltaproteobacteria bacterium]|nr:hypothetical protein [Deltaproteobacteria bacterium]